MALDPEERQLARLYEQRLTKIVFELEDMKKMMSNMFQILAKK